MFANKVVLCDKKHTCVTVTGKEVNLQTKEELSLKFRHELFWTLHPAQLHLC